jgi:hypothetical protein
LKIFAAMAMSTRRIRFKVELLGANMSQFK